MKKKNLLFCITGLLLMMLAVLPTPLSAEKQKGKTKEKLAKAINILDKIGGGSGVQTLECYEETIDAQSAQNDIVWLCPNAKDEEVLACTPYAGNEGKGVERKCKMASTVINQMLNGYKLTLK